VKNLGYILITIGFLVGSYFSVLHAEKVQWSMVLPGLVVGLLGVAMIQLSLRGRSKAVDAVRSNIGKLEESLARIVDNITQLDADNVGSRHLRRKPREYWARLRAPVLRRRDDPFRDCRALSQSLLVCLR
jgi:hypothetical protein